MNSTTVRVMGTFAFQMSSRLCLHLSLRRFVQNMLIGNRTYIGVASIKSTLCDTRLSSKKWHCCQNRWKHDEQMNFPLYKRIPQRYAEEIDNIVESYHEKIVYLASLFQCEVDLIKTLVRKDTRLVTSFNIDDVSEKIRLLRHYGYSIEDAITYSSVFHRSVQELTRRLEEMHEVRKVSKLLRPACMSRSKYRKVMDEMQKDAALIDGHASRDSYVAALLGCTESDLKKMTAHGFRHLLTRRPSHLTTLVEMLTSYGFSLQEIRENPGVLHTSIKLASERLKRMSDLGLLFKEHMVFILTSSDVNIDNVIAPWIKEKEALGPHSDRKHYLMHRLAMNEDQYKTIIMKARAIQKMNARRLKQGLDVLIEEIELQIEDIQMNPTLLYYSSERLSQRWMVLQEAGVVSKKVFIKELKLSETDFAAKYSEFM